MRAGWSSPTSQPTIHTLLREVAASAGNRRQPINIQFTSGTTGLPKGATLSHRNIVNNAFFVGTQHGPEGRRPALHSGAALSLLRHGDVESRLRRARRDDGLSLPPASIRSRCSRRASRALHGAARRADDVHRGAPASASSTQFDSRLAARRHHGGRALPDRGHAPGRRPHAHARSHHRLRHDRDEPGELPELDRTIRSSGACRRSDASSRTWKRR